MNRSHRLAVLAVLAFLAVPLAAQSTDHRGSVAPAKNAARTVVIQPDAKYVNVDRWEIVSLMYNDKSFTWKFDTFGAPNFSLAEIAPSDFGTGHVRVYVSDRSF